MRSLIERSISDYIDKRQLIWYRYVQRIDGRRPSREVMNWISQEIRKRGKPKKNWHVGIRKAMSEKNLQEGPVAGSEEVANGYRNGILDQFTNLGKAFETVD